jgi:hypothetical protein
MVFSISSWLEQWITIDNAVDHLDISFTEIDNQPFQQALVEVKWNGPLTVVSEVQVNMKLSDSKVECSWKPHLAPEEDMVIGDLVFRSPVMIFEKEDEMLALVPDLEFLKANRTIPHYIDYVEPDRTLFYGLGHYEKTKHVYHRRVETPFHVNNGQTLFRFFFIHWNGLKEKRNFLPVSDFLWESFAKKQMIQQTESLDSVVDSVTDLEVYAKHAYDWAFNRWEEIVWNEFELDNRQVGGCVFIVRGVQTPGNGQEDNWREKKSLWNQAWFSSLRSAYGYRIWGEKWKNTDYIRRSELAKNFALSAPQKNGLFPSVYWAAPDQSWKNGFWGYSDRRPIQHEGYAHLLDMSWTCLWMLKWYMDIEKDEELLQYTKNYAQRLLELQLKNGSFPAWVHEESGLVSPYLINSPETSIHVWLFAKLYLVTKDRIYLESAIKGINYVRNNVLPEGRWEDFETYWSCSREWEGKNYGQKDKRSGLYNQCNFSIYWTTEALKELFLATDNEDYLREGEKVLAELSLYQAIWEPSFLHVPVLGGFGVMTSDDEWNDARQSLFALTYHDYFKLTGKQEYQYRSIWAMRASFYMMYCPENPAMKKLYENFFPHFSDKDFGFEMENAHHGENSELHIGEFAIFDWGSGSAAASLGEMLNRNSVDFKVKCEKE